MVLVGSSVWIDWFNANDTVQTRKLDELTGSTILLIGDLILLEVLQGFREQRAYDQAHATLRNLEPLDIGGHDVAKQAAKHYRSLREMGITVCKTIEVLIATRCIINRIPLLYSDRDFDPFVEHLGLQNAIT